MLLKLVLLLIFYEAYTRLFKEVRANGLKMVKGNGPYGHRLKRYKY
jgi:hypothetical protein